MIDNEKKPRLYGLKEPLYTSEIHMLMMIGQNPEAGVTELAGTELGWRQVLRKLAEQEVTALATAKAGEAV